MNNYKIKSEKGKVVNTVPKWYMADFSETKACDTPRFGKGKEKECIFGVGTSVSPDLNLAIEKAKMSKSPLVRSDQNFLNPWLKPFSI